MAVCDQQKNFMLPFGQFAVSFHKGLSIRLTFDCSLLRRFWEEPLASGFPVRALHTVTTDNLGALAVPSSLVVTSDATADESGDMTMLSRRELDQGQSDTLSQDFHSRSSSLHSSPVQPH